MTKTGTFVPSNGDDTELKFAELYDRHKQHLGWLGIAVILIGGGVWFYLRSESIKSQRAEAAFEAAVQSVAVGNIPLAESDLKKAAVRYAGTDGGSQSSMALAKIYYQQGKFQEGIDALKAPAADKGDVQYEAVLLVAAGYEGLTKWPDAAHEYETAASIARFDADKQTALAMAARAYKAGGNKAAATKIWNQLATDPKGTFSAEAKIRLGELEATAAKA